MSSESNRMERNETELGWAEPMRESTVWWMMSIEDSSTHANTCTVHTTIWFRERWKEKQHFLCSRSINGNSWTKHTFSYILSRCGFFSIQFFHRWIIVWNQFKYCFFVVFFSLSVFLKIIFKSDFPVKSDGCRNHMQETQKHILLVEKLIPNLQHSQLIGINGIFLQSGQESDRRKMANPKNWHTHAIQCWMRRRRSFSIRADRVSLVRGNFHKNQHCLFTSYGWMNVVRRKSSSFTIHKHVFC